MNHDEGPEPREELAIWARGLTKRYGEIKAVTNLDLEVRRGEVYGFLGLNGAGKTTTVQMLAGALPPTSGIAYVLGSEVGRSPRATAHQVGVVFGENITAEPSFSPLRYLRYFGRLYQLDDETIDARTRWLVDTLELHADAQRPVRELSSGNRRKVELARALLHGPALLFLDEPTRELDIPTKRAMWQLFIDLVEAGEVTIFLSSHDVQEIATLCTRIGVIREGKKIWEGAPDSASGEAGTLVDGLSRLLSGGELKHKRRFEQ